MATSFLKQTSTARASLLHNGGSGTHGTHKSIPRHANSEMVSRPRWCQHFIMLHMRPLLTVLCGGLINGRPLGDGAVRDGLVNLAFCGLFVKKAPTSFLIHTASTGAAPGGFMNPTRIGWLDFEKISPYINARLFWSHTLLRPVRPCCLAGILYHKSQSEFSP